MKRLLLLFGIATTITGAAIYVPAQPARPAKPPIETAIKVADGVWFEQHNDIGAYGSNVAWIEFADFVAVVDTAFPRGAEAALKSIKQTTHGKRIRYAIVTHYHGDHTFGTGVFAKEGAIIVGHENARKDFIERSSLDYPKRAKTDKVAAKYQPAAPQISFTDHMTIDDGKGRVAELYHFGHAHTTGCIFTWLPKEKVVLTGDAVVNGNFNYLADSNTASWIDVVAQVQALGPTTVLPGHGPVGGADVLDKQKQYFVDLRNQVAALVGRNKTLDDIQTLVDIPAWKAWTGETKMNRDGIAHVYQELTRGLGFTQNAGAGNAIAVPMETGKDRPTLKFLTDEMDADRIAGIKRLAPNVEIVIARDKKDAVARAADVQGCSGNLVTSEFMRAAGNLRWVQQFSAGVEDILAVPELHASDKVVLTNMKTVYGPNIGDHAFALLLSLTRGLPAYQALMKTGTWEKRRPGAPVPGELKDKTMVIVGLGGIGGEVARRAHAFGMRVLATDARTITTPWFVDRIEPPDRLAALLPLADVLVVAAPLTGKTQGLIGAPEFALLRPGAYFIDVSRGKIYDNMALADALRNGRLAGAGVDVTDPEPLPPGHPLWKAPNLIITPHVAGRSPGSAARIRALFMENMRRFAAGEPLLNVVDKRAGY